MGSRRQLGSEARSSPCALFGVGYLLYGQYTGAVVCLVLVAASGFVLYRVLTQMLATEPLVEG